MFFDSMIHFLLFYINYEGHSRKCRSTLGGGEVLNNCPGAPEITVILQLVKNSEEKISGKKYYIQDHIYLHIEALSMPSS